MPPDQTAASPSGFEAADWIVIAIYLLLTTIIGARLAGKQATIRDFFLGGRTLPWWAICGSIIATEISAATVVIVPSISFREGGNFTYLQLAVGAIIGRLIIGYYFIPRYYEREIYSPYDYLERQLGSAVKKATTGLFLVGGILGQGARVYITALVLSTIADWNLVTSIWAIGLFSVGWTLLGGITTVIWTDVVQFVVLVTGAFLALVFAVHGVPDSFPAAVEVAADAHKFQVFNLSTNPTVNYTLWCGLLAAPFLNLAAFGTDQVMAQRIFCCRNQADARKAIIVSSLSLCVTVLMLCLGAALYVYFLREPFLPHEQARYAERADYLLPIFIVRALPVGIRGIIVAAIFASAVSTLDSTLAALSQTTLSAFIKPRLRPSRKKTWYAPLLSSDIRIAKALVVAWGVVLCLMATACVAIADQQANAVDLAFALVSYTYGPLLGIFLLAFLTRRRTAAGLIWAVPITVLAIFGLSQHDLIVGSVRGHAIDVADWIVWFGAAAILTLGLIRSRGSLLKVAVTAAGALAVAMLHRYQPADPHGATGALAFPWLFPVGTAMTFIIGYLLGKERPDPSAPARSVRPAPPKRTRRRKTGRTRAK